MAHAVIGTREQRVAGCLGRFPQLVRLGLGTGSWIALADSSEDWTASLCLAQSQEQRKPLINGSEFTRCYLTKDPTDSPLVY